MANPYDSSNPLSIRDLFSLTINQTNQSLAMCHMAESALATAAQDEDTVARQGGGSRPGKAPNLDRSHLQGHQGLLRDYFVDGPQCFPAEKFRRRYRMNRNLFLRIVDAVTLHDPYFVQKPDAVGRLGLSPLQKCTAAIRMLAYGTPADLQDEYLRLSESTALESLERFCSAVHHQFSDEYRREPTQEDINHILEVNEARGFPGMLGSLDCMHWSWKNCPAAHAGQYKGKEDCPTLILEAVATHNLWIWNSFFGLPGSLNDINVLHKSPIFQRLAKGVAPKCRFSIAGRDFDIGYYLADGIYPKWATLVQTISHPQDNRKKVSFLSFFSKKNCLTTASAFLQDAGVVSQGRGTRLWRASVLIRHCREPRPTLETRNFTFDH